ncbi:MAG: permease prefix domain 1-containing protein [Phycisphaerales bacterium]
MVDMEPNPPTRSSTKTKNNIALNASNKQDSFEPLNLPVTPSSRDSISSWLDVLTSMLSLPESKRTQIRDELEDHLRSRVDDLLITGTPEPEAIQLAVAELGETVELAKVISLAHTHSKPRRRIVNTALILTAIAGLSIGGISMNNSARTTTAAGAALAPSALVLADEPESDHQGGMSKEFSFEDEMAAVILMKVAEAFGADIEFVSDSSQDLKFMSASFEGEHTLETAIRELNRAHLPTMNNHRAVLEGNTIRVMSADEYNRSRIDLRIYPSPKWIRTPSERIDYKQSLVNLLAIKHDLVHTSIEVVNATIIVASTPEVHVEIQALVTELNTIIQQRDQENEAERESRDAQREADRKKSRESQLRREELQEQQSTIEFQQAVNQLQAEFDSARTKLLSSKAKMRLIELEINTLKNPFADTSEKAQESTTQQSQLQSLGLSLDSAQLELDENEERYNYLRSRLLDSQYAQLFSGLD